MNNKNTIPKFVIAIGIWSLWIILFLTIGLTAYLSAKLAFPPPDHRWLNKQPCSAPCWEGITPGVTTAEEAAQLLQQNPLFSNVEIKISPKYPDSSAVVWQWSGTDANGGASFDAESSDHILRDVSVYFITPIKLKDIIRAYGNPSHIYPRARPGVLGESEGLYYGMSIYYLSFGFQFTFASRNPSLKPTVSPETEIVSIRFFPASMEGLKAATGLDNMENRLIPWQDTFDFDTYCKLAYTGELADRCK